MKEVTPRIGNNAKGSKAVTATGTVSVAHHTAISTTTPATFHAVSFNPSGDGRKRNKKNNIIERTQLSFYEKDIASGLLSIEAAMEKIKEAYGEKLDWETKGWTLPPAKTAYPVFSGEEED